MNLTLGTRPRGSFRRSLVIVVGLVLACGLGPVAASDSVVVGGHSASHTIAVGHGPLAASARGRTTSLQDGVGPTFTELRASTTNRFVHRESVLAALLAAATCHLLWSRRRRANAGPSTKLGKLAVQQRGPPLLLLAA